MKLPSFRLRIALLSVLLAGSALIGFGIAAWLLIYETKVSRLNDQIKTQLIQESSRPHPQDHWESYEIALRSILLGIKSEKAVVLLVIDGRGETLYQSSNLPWDLNLNSLLSTEYNVTSKLFTQQNFLPPRLAENPPPPPQSSLSSVLKQELPFPRNQPPEMGQQSPFPPPRNAQLPMPEPPMISQEQFNQLIKITTKQTKTGNWQIGTVVVPHIRIAMAISFTEIDQEMSAIRNIFLISVPAVLVLVAFGAWWLSASALQPIHQVTATIRNVTAKGLDQRILITGSDIEFVEMLQVFNLMMERLERSFKQASRFSADAAHELKTPLAILQGELERALQQADLGSEMQQNLGHLLDEVRRLGTIIRKLLLLSLADAGQMRLHKIKVDLSSLLADIVEDIEMLAPHLNVEVKIAPKLQIQADKDLLIQVFHNLISNAIKYNVSSGWIKLEAKAHKNQVFVTISNSSKDIPAQEKEQIFDRFHRGDPARTRQIEGLGLGLSLAREIVRAHGGELKLDITPVGQTAFTISISNEC